MVGPRTHSTVEEVERGWDEWVAQHGFGIRRRDGDYSTDLRTSRKRLVAYVSGGRWIADCPNCNGGVPVWNENPRGVCLDCGTIYRIDHPAADELVLVADLLGARPDPLTRNWNRHQGETLDDLAAENATLVRARDASELLIGVDVVARVLGDDALLRLQEAGVVPNPERDRLVDEGMI